MKKTKAKLLKWLGTISIIITTTGFLLGDLYIGFSLLAGTLVGIGNLCLLFALLKWIKKIKNQIVLSGFFLAKMIISLFLIYVFIKVLKLGGVYILVGVSVLPIGVIAWAKGIDK
jgi:hypothetical protein